MSTLTIAERSFCPRSSRLFYGDPMPHKKQNHMPSRKIVWASTRHYLLLNHRSPISSVISRLHRLCITGARLTLITCPTQPGMYWTQIHTQHEYFLQVVTCLYIPYSRAFRSTVSSTATLPQITQTYSSLWCLAHTPSEIRQLVHPTAFERPRKTSHARASSASLLIVVSAWSHEHSPSQTIITLPALGGRCAIASSGENVRQRSCMMRPRTSLTRVSYCGS